MTVLLLVSGVIHLLPLPGLLGADRLAALYGTRFADPNLVILMRHRAVLFAMLGALLVYAAFTPSARTHGIIAGLVSVVSFMLIARGVGGYNAQLRRVVIADAVALAALVAAAGLHHWPTQLAVFSDVNPPGCPLGDALATSSRAAAGCTPDLRRT